VRRDLADGRMGQLVGADNRTYSIRVPRVERAEIEALIESGCPVVSYLPGGRRSGTPGRRVAGLDGCPKRA
jgi:hypothetical protein